MPKMKLEIDQSYKEKLDILKKVFVTSKGNKIEDDGVLVGELIDTFLEFLQNQATEMDEDSDGGSCCGGGGCGNH